MVVAAANAPVETITLIQVCAAGNSNKFYELSRMPDGSTVARYGRIGAGKAQTCTYPAGSFRRKLEEKLRRGYTVFDGAGIGQSSAAPTPNTADLTARVLAGLFPTASNRAAARDLITALVRANRHAIDTATGGRITVSDTGAVTTALGPVSLRQIATARVELNALRAGYDQYRVESYLRLIPQKIVNVRDTSWVTRSWCRRQDDLLDALESAVTMSATAAAAAESDDVSAIPFRHNLIAVDPGSETFSEIAAKFDRSRNTQHAANGLTLRRAWALADTSDAAWDSSKDRLKHSRQLWHGTTTGNVLSILRTGLICPPAQGGSYNITGRMFGDGVYFSDQSTKALNYAIGSAPGQSRSSAAGTPMMFLADVVMGRECRSEPGELGSALVRRSRNGVDTKGRGFDSLFVRGGHCGVRNNEMVVWRTEQIKLTHLCEFR